MSIRYFLRILENIPRRMVLVSSQSINFEGGGTMRQDPFETSLFDDVLKISFFSIFIFVSTSEIFLKSKNIFEV